MTWKKNGGRAEKICPWLDAVLLVEAPRGSVNRIFFLLHRFSAIYSNGRGKRRKAKVIPEIAEF
jgi:hypothetical protein